MKVIELKELSFIKIDLFLQMFKEDIDLPFNDIEFEFVVNLKEK